MARTRGLSFSGFWEMSAAHEDDDLKVNEDRLTNDENIEPLSVFGALKSPKKEPTENDPSTSSIKSAPPMFRKQQRKRATRSYGENPGSNFVLPEHKKAWEIDEYLEDQDPIDNHRATEINTSAPPVSGYTVSEILSDHIYEPPLNVFEHVLNSSGTRSSSESSLLDSGVNDYLRPWGPDDYDSGDSDVLELSEDEFDDTEMSVEDEEQLGRSRKRKHDDVDVSQGADTKEEIKRWVSTEVATYDLLCMSRVPCPDTMAFHDAVFTKKTDSSENGKSALEWLIAPYSFEMFFQRIYQQKIFVTCRQNELYYDNFLTLKRVTEILKRHEIKYGVDVNMIVNQIDGCESLSLSGKAYLTDIRSRLQERCVLELLHLPMFSNNVWHICELLQEVFCASVRASAYLTPADIVDISCVPEHDRFILQLEGAVKWKIRDLGCGDDMERQAAATHTVFNGLLTPGDLLYVPKGFNCRGFSQVNRHSVFVYIDVNSGNFPFGCFEKFYESAVARLQEKNVVNHRSLVSNVELAKNWCSEPSFEAIVKRKLAACVSKQADCLKDDFNKCCKMAAQTMYCDFLSSALPPKLSKAECRKSATGGPNFDLLLEKSVSFTPEDKVKFLRRHGQRLITKDKGLYFVVHRMANSRYAPDSVSEVSFRLEPELIAGFDQLVDTYPGWCKIRDLKCATMDEKRNLAETLYANGLIMVKDSDAVEE